MLVPFTPDESSLLKPVNHSRDRARREAGHLRKPAGGGAAFENEEIKALKIGTRDSRVIGDGLAEDRARARGAPHRVFQFLHQRCSRFPS